MEQEGLKKNLLAWKEPEFAHKRYAYKKTLRELKLPQGLKWKVNSITFADCTTMIFRMYYIFRITIQRVAASLLRAFECPVLKHKTKKM